MRCPLCGNEAKETIAKELRDGTKRNVYFCGRCELGLLSKELSEEELKRFYKEKYRTLFKPKLAAKSNSAEMFRMYAPFQGDRLRLLKPYLSKKKRLLEVGCSVGMFLFHAKPLVKEVVGIDYDVSAARYAAKKCRCTVYTDAIEQTPLKERSFDIICLFETLEHVKEPSELIATLKRYLAPGGLIAVEVPNLYSCMAHVYDLPLYRKFFFHSAHLWYFTEKSLKKLMGGCGFTGKVSYLQDYNIVNHMNWIINDKPQSDCLPGLSQATLPIRPETPPHIRKKLLAFIADTDAGYRKMLAGLKVTSIIMYIGRPK